MVGKVGAGGWMIFSFFFGDGSVDISDSSKSVGDFNPCLVKMILLGTAVVGQQ